MKAPIALFVYNRPKHTKKTIEALINNDGAKDSELFAFSDGAKDETEEGNVEAVREYLSRIADGNYFKKVHLINAKNNRGLEISIIEGVTKVINQYGKIIVLEDDIITSSDFLRFMNSALNAYEMDLNIWSISSYSLNNNKIRKCPEDVLWTYRGECWGWASWSDRWNKVDWNVEDYAEILHDKKVQKAFNRAGRDMFYLLDLQQKKIINSWAIRWCYQEYKENMITIFPKNPKSYNNGLDGSGTNCSDEAHKQVEMQFIVENDWNFNYSLENKILVREFQKMYFINYWRQKLGSLWYNLTEYEYCLAYKKQNEEYKVLKPNYKEWYADPIPFLWREKQYVFMEVYNKYGDKGRIGLSSIEKDGYLSRPKTIIEEPFHLSFPNVFIKDGQVYMVPECCAVNQIRIYKMQNDIYHWDVFKVFSNVGELVDSIIYEGIKGKVYLICCETNPHNKHQTCLKQYEILNFGDPSIMELKENWRQKEYSYCTRNAGGFINKKNNIYRVAQESTDKVYGKAVIINCVLELNEYILKEKFQKKITPATEKINLPKFVYRKWGVHTYGETNNFIIIDLLVQRFSLGGLWIKIWRRVKNWVPFLN